MFENGSQTCSDLRRCPPKWMNIRSAESQDLRWATTPNVLGFHATSHQIGTESLSVFDPFSLAALSCPEHNQSTPGKGERKAMTQPCQLTRQLLSHPLPLPFGIAFARAQPGPIAPMSKLPSSDRVWDVLSAPLCPCLWSFVRVIRAQTHTCVCHCAAY